MRGKPQPVEYNGKAYVSIRALCIDLGLSSTAVTKRLRRGLSVEDAVIGRINKRGPKKVVFRGREYPNIAAVAHEAGIRPSTLRDRLSRGLSIEEATRKTRQHIAHKAEAESKAKMERTALSAEMWECAQLAMPARPVEYWEW